MPFNVLHVWQVFDLCPLFDSKCPIKIKRFTVVITNVIGSLFRPSLFIGGKAKSQSDDVYVTTRQGPRLARKH